MLGSVLPSYCFFAAFNAAPFTGFASLTLLVFGLLPERIVAVVEFVLDIIGLPKFAAQHL